MRGSIFIILIFICFSVYGQADTGNRIEKPHSRYGIVFIPNEADNIYGLGVGLIGSELLCYVKHTRNSYGINFQLIGQGVFQAFAIGMPIYKRDYQDYLQSGNFQCMDTLTCRTVHYGLLISVFGTYTSVTNGINLSPWMSMSHMTNGISCNLLWNYTQRLNGLSIGLINTVIIMKGLQIGFINKSILLKGIQIGLWNKNERRSLPFINWNFNKSLSK